MSQSSGELDAMLWGDAHATAYSISRASWRAARKQKAPLIDLGEMLTSMSHARSVSSSIMSKPYSSCLPPERVGWLVG